MHNSQFSKKKKLFANIRNILNKNIFFLKIIKNIGKFKNQSIFSNIFEEDKPFLRGRVFTSPPQRSTKSAPIISSIL